MDKLYELNKLEAYLKDNGYVYERIDESPWHDGYIDKHIVIVYEGKDENGNFKNRLWDAICHFGSYGYAEGLLEEDEYKAVKRRFAAGKLPETDDQQSEH